MGSRGEGYTAIIKRGDSMPSDDRRKGSGDVVPDSNRRIRNLHGVRIRAGALRERCGYPMGFLVVQREALNVRGADQ